MSTLTGHAVWLSVPHCLARLFALTYLVLPHCMAHSLLHCVLGSQLSARASGRLVLLRRTLPSDLTKRISMVDFLTSDDEVQVVDAKISSTSQKSSGAGGAVFSTDDEGVPAPAPLVVTPRRPKPTGPACDMKRQREVQHDNFETSEEEIAPSPRPVAKKGRGRKAGGEAMRKKPAAVQKPDAEAKTAEAKATEAKAKAAEAKAAKAKAAAKAAEAKPQGPVPQGEFAPMSVPTVKALPKSSGAFDFARWAVSQLTSTEVSLLAQDEEITIGSVCSGQSTESLAAEALSRCVAKFRYTITLLCECDGRKAKHLQKLHPSALIVKDVAELAHQLVKDVKGKLREKPDVKVLFAGISCKGLSGLNNNPESVLGRGSTGTTLRGLRDYVLSLPLEERPRIIILENVANMAKKRQVEQGCKVAAQIVADLFDKLGYTADWKIFNSKDYFHPQSRERLWMVLWRRPFLECSLAAHEKYAKVLQEVMAFMGRFMTQSHEPLASVLDRMQLSAQRKSKARESEELSEKAKKENTAYAVKHHLLISPKDEAEFFAKVRPLMTKRAAQVAYLKMAHAKKQHGWSWEKDLLVASVSQSVSWMTVAKDCFPTLTPTHPFLVLHHGNAFHASGRLALAVQGVQQDEAIFMKMDGLPEALQQDFGGNAFSSNICIGLLVSSVLAHSAFSN